MNIETEHNTNLTTDHLPMTITIKNKLAALDQTKTRGRKKYEICNREENTNYNQKVLDNTTDNFKDTLITASENTIPTKETKMRKHDMSIKSIE